MRTPFVFLTKEQQRRNKKLQIRIQLQMFNSEYNTIALTLMFWNRCEQTV